MNLPKTQTKMAVYWDKDPDDMNIDTKNVQMMDKVKLYVFDYINFLLCFFFCDDE